jgi:stearoyl-CoA desaturase (delta-9 desaturase)
MERNRSGQTFSWLNSAVLVSFPLAAFAGFVHYGLSDRALDRSAVLAFAVLTAATALAITAGYHRYYSHRSYECSRPVRAFYLLFGAAALQNSALCWALNHRDHHRFVDEDRDPHNIKKGRFWTYIGWVFFKDSESRSFEIVRDLEEDRWVRWQHRNYVPLGLAIGFGLPGALGLALGAPFDFLFLALVRVVLLHHVAFLGNLYGHSIGVQTYSRRDSSRDSFWLALLTLGDGYHNFHHTFPSDYRTGVRWFHWDPTKWWIRGLALFGLAWELHRTPREVASQTRARLLSVRAV